MKTKVVVFTENNARILINPSPMPQAGPRVFINPDLSAVRGVAPHFWKVAHGKIVPMSRPEKALRLQHIASNGAINNPDIKSSFLSKTKTFLIATSPLWWVALGALLTWLM